MRFGDILVGPQHLWASSRNFSVSHVRRAATPDPWNSKSNSSWPDLLWIEMVDTCSWATNTLYFYTWIHGYWSWTHRVPRYSDVLQENIVLRYLCSRIFVLRYEDIVLRYYAGSLWNYQGPCRVLLLLYRWFMIIQKQAKDGYLWGTLSHRNWPWLSHMDTRAQILWSLDLHKICNFFPDCWISDERGAALHMPSVPFLPCACQRSLPTGWNSLLPPVWAVHAVSMTV